MVPLEGVEEETSIINFLGSQLQVQQVSVKLLKQSGHFLARNLLKNTIWLPKKN
jgi:hypothetical protein